MLRRLSLYTFLLCFVPFFTWIFSWQWHGDSHLTSFDYFLYWLTETGSVPYAVISCGVLSLCFLPIFSSKSKWISAVIIMAISMLITQGIKTAAKTVFAEPRPYASALAEQSGVTTDYFYDQTREQRAMIVSQFYANKAEVPTWLVHHRENETGYSFPSGHTIFAASWLLLAVGFTQIVGRCRMSSKILVLGILLWSVLMLVSRLRLGMHHPIDLLISTLIAWLVHLPLFFYIEQKQIFQQNSVELVK
ncbi:phosphatase PAP2 family protein [Lonepinella sp. MS14436]|uniref:phosphatase PAP2 family protein n=1 Tax=Lonepinella sp. MS14436 TaxID=3003619 RepID=UPI0036D8F10E